MPWFVWLIVFVASIAIALITGYNAAERKLKTKYRRMTDEAERERDRFKMLANEEEGAIKVYCEVCSERRSVEEHIVEGYAKLANHLEAWDPSCHCHKCKATLRPAIEKTPEYIEAMAKASERRRLLDAAGEYNDRNMPKAITKAHHPGKQKPAVVVEDRDEP